MRIYQNKTLTVAILTGLLLTFCVMQASFGYSHQNSCVDAWGTDDAYISYHYAHNLFYGNGLVYNPGERVEGYSNLLYVLLLLPAFIYKQGIGIYIYSLVLNILFIIVAFWIFSQYLGSISKQFALLGSILFIFFPPFWAWVASGLETPLVLLLQILMCVLVSSKILEGNKKYWTLLFCATIVFSVLTRADGFILPGIATIYLILKKDYRRAMLCAITILLSLSLLFTWRYQYYQDFLPNTYYAKVSGKLADRFAYAGELLLVISVIQGLLPYLIIHFVSIVVLCKQLFQKIEFFRHSLTFESVFSIIWIAYWIFIGGDIFFERFLIILVPFGISTLIRILENLKLKRSGYLIITCIMLFQISTLFLDKRFSYSLHKNDCMLTLGNFLAKEYPKAKMAIGAAGKPAYISNLYTIDMFGLNNSFIAHLPEEEIVKFTVGHTKFSSNYVLSQNPNLIGGWLNNLDLDAGLTRQIYSKAGYKIRYLLYMRPTITNQQPIIDMKKYDESNIQTFINQGYGYALLEKNDQN